MGTEFISAVRAVCEEGQNLAKSINEFFPNFTLHDVTHIENVCKWMWQLLGDKQRGLSVREAALLVMSACCHDMGMAVSDEQKEDMRSQAIAGDDPGWANFFKRHHSYYLEMRSSHEVSDEMLRCYVRENHAARVAEQLESWDGVLDSEGLHRKDFIALCASHGSDLSSIDKTVRNREFAGEAPDPDYGLCAALLRIADLLDYDVSRAPKRLLAFKGLDKSTGKEQKISTVEWIKNGTGKFRLQGKDLLYSAKITDPGIDHDIREYLDWVDDELSMCGRYLRRHNGRWSTFELPEEVGWDAEPRGYETGDFRLTMDQDRVLELLSGESLYGSPDVFVRELLQNAIDAVHARVQLDPTFSASDGRVDVRTWFDHDGYGWFSITDNGVGMDKHAIETYFLKIGQSYYDSDEYKSDVVASGGDTSDLPISRFGIGILSCFMGKSDNQIEVVTKRFSQNGSSHYAYRLDVTGLHGYYVLSKLEHKGSGLEALRPDYIDYPKAPRDDNSHSIGTTIYVRVSLYALGGTRRFKDMLDKYVRFPKVRVTYEGPDGCYKYPTQDELMDLVHMLNPDGPGHELRTYEYPLTSEAFEELKEGAPEIEWEHEPRIVVRYCPLDWFAHSKKIAGVAVAIDIDDGMVGKKIPVDSSLIKDFGLPILTINSRDWYFDNAGVHLAISATDERSSVMTQLTSIRLNPSSFAEQITPAEERLNSYVMADCRFEQFGGVAYRGVTVDSPSRSAYTDSALFISCVLLNDGYRPHVKLSRAGSTSLPLEAFLDMELTDYSLRHLKASGLMDYSIFSGLYYDGHVDGAELRVLFKIHPDWKDKWPYLWEREYADLADRLKQETRVEISCDQLGYCHDLDTAVTLFLLKEDFAVSMDFHRDESILLIENRKNSEESPESSYLDFPPELFIQPIGETRELGRIIRGGPYGTTVLLNLDHALSQWLVEWGRRLKKDAPNMFAALLSGLRGGSSKEGVINSVNRTLDILKQVPGDPFKACALPVLCDNDIIDSV